MPLEKPKWTAVPNYLAADKACPGCAGKGASPSGTPLVHPTPAAPIKGAQLSLTHPGQAKLSLPLVLPPTSPHIIPGMAGPSRYNPARGCYEAVQTLKPITEALAHGFHNLYSPGDGPPLDDTEELTSSTIIRHHGWWETYAEPEAPGFHHGNLHTGYGLSPGDIVEWHRVPKDKWIDEYHNPCHLVLNATCSYSDENITPLGMGRTVGDRYNTVDWSISVKSDDPPVYFRAFFGIVAFQENGYIFESWWSGSDYVSSKGPVASPASDVGTTDILHNDVEQVIGPRTPFNPEKAFQASRYLVLDVEAWDSAGCYERDLVPKQARIEALRASLRGAKRRADHPTPAPGAARARVACPTHFHHRSSSRFSDCRVSSIEVEGSLS